MTISETTIEDFRATKTFASGPDPVFAALTDIDALTGWWTPAAGGAGAGATLRFLMGDQEVVMHVDSADRPTRVRWNVLLCEPAPDWIGTSIIFTLETDGPGTELHFEHRGLTPQLECFGQCHAGWTHFLASLVDFVDRGDGHPNVATDPERFAAWRAVYAAH